MRKWSAVFNGWPISDFAVGTMPACSDCFNYWGALSEKESLAKELAQSKAVEVCIYNKLCFHSWKRTIIYMVFGFYFTAVLALVGFPNIASLKIDFAVNVIPFFEYGFGFRKIPMIKKVYDVLVYQQTYRKDIATRFSQRKGFESGLVF